MTDKPGKAEGEGTPGKGGKGDQSGKELNEPLMALAKRRGFIYPSYDIYGGVAGFYDYGPLGAPLKHNIENCWREIFVLGEGFFEIETPAIGIEAVFEASGHLKEFSDLLVECRKCGEAFRADHLITHLVPNADALTPEELDKVIKENKVRCPECKGELTEARPFNLMFKTNIGPGSKRAGYLRPETAQAMFTNFNFLYRHNRERLPFGAVQIGRGYRNEISPRQGIIRIRELNMAEAEIFFHPEHKVHPLFKEVSGDKVMMGRDHGR
jgi:glycyl-tRNA synthetase